MLYLCDHLGILDTLGFRYQFLPQETEQNIKSIFHNSWNQHLWNKHSCTQTQSHFQPKNK